VGATGTRASHDTRRAPGDQSGAPIRKSPRVKDLLRALRPRKDTRLAWEERPSVRRHLHLRRCAIVFTQNSPMGEGAGGPVQGGAVQRFRLRLGSYSSQASVSYARLLISTRSVSPPLMESDMAFTVMDSRTPTAPTTGGVF
jgi:hypothetical protein